MDRKYGGNPGRPGDGRGRGDPDHVGAPGDHVQSRAAEEGGAGVGQTGGSSRFHRRHALGQVGGSSVRDHGDPLGLAVAPGERPEHRFQVARDAAAATEMSSIDSDPHCRHAR